MPYQARFFIYLFLSGSVTSFFFFSIVLSVGNDSIDLALQYIEENREAYALIAGSSGAAWVVLGLFWLNISKQKSLLRYFATAIISSTMIGPLGLMIKSIADHILNDSDIDTNVFNPATYWMDIYNSPLYLCLNLVRGVALTVVLWKMRTSATKAALDDQAVFPSTMLHDEADQVTRVLCGQALLDGTDFRRRVVGFFENKLTAVAPEYGFDVQLVCSVCEFANSRSRIYYVRLLFVALFGFTALLFMPGLAISIFIILSAGVRLWKVGGDINLSREFRKSSFRPNAAVAKYAAWQSDAIRRSLPPSGQNVVVYKGFSPFIGAGLDLDGWSIVTRIDKPNTEKGVAKAQEFEKKEIYSALQSGMSQMELRNVTCHDVIFARGIDVRENSHFLGDVAYRPNLLLPEAIFDPYFTESKGVIRGYKRIQFIGWGGDIIITMFVRFSIEGKNLVLELRRFLLPPISNKMRRVDATPPDTLGLVFARFLRSLVVGPLQALVSPLVVWGEITGAIGKALRNDDREAEARRKRVEEDLSFDHGANVSLREQFAQRHFAHYFQKADFDSVSKLIERRILNIVEDFLEDHGIDASDFRDRQTSILNSGIIVQGGNVRAESLAVGQGAQANKVENYRSANAKEGGP